MLNHITIMGRLTRDPELRHTGIGTPVCSFTLAVDRDFADKNSGEKQTDFIDCVAWRNTGEFVSKYFSKGSMAVVAGRIQVRDYTDRDGNKRRATEVVAEHVYFGESKKSDSGRAEQPRQQSSYNSNSYQSSTPSYGYGGGFAELENDDYDLPWGD